MLTGRGDVGQPPFQGCPNDNCVKADTEGKYVTESEQKQVQSGISRPRQLKELLLALISMPEKSNVLCFSWVVLGRGRDSFLPFEIIKEYEGNHVHSYLCVGKPRCSG